MYIEECVSFRSLVSIPVDKVRAYDLGQYHIVPGRAGFQSPWIRFALWAACYEFGSEGGVSIPVDKVRASAWELAELLTARFNPRG